jgi:ribosomal protein S18 acetylase RimI-like enzyme
MATCDTLNCVDTAKTPGMSVGYTTNTGQYLDRVAEFLRRRPVEHSVLLSVAASHDSDEVVGAQVVGAQSNLWLWVQDDQQVVAAAQHTPPRCAYLSTGPAEAMRMLAATLWRLRPGLPGVTGLGGAPQEFATQWSRLGGPAAAPAMAQCLYAADEVVIPMGIVGRLRKAIEADAWLLRGWVDLFKAEAGVASGAKDEVGPRVDAGLLFVWEAGGAVLSMAAVTPAQGGVSRVQFVYTPPKNRRRGFASACVAALTARELATPGRTCMLYTDLANPTSNGIYRALGYRRVADAVELRFAADGLGGR